MSETPVGEMDRLNAPQDPDGDVVHSELLEQAAATGTVAIAGYGWSEGKTFPLPLREDRATVEYGFNRLRERGVLIKASGHLRKLNQGSAH